MYVCVMNMSFVPWRLDTHLHLYNSLFLLMRKWREVESGAGTGGRSRGEGGTNSRTGCIVEA